jgi:hypothetical protein
MNPGSSILKFMPITFGTSTSSVFEGWDGSNVKAAVDSLMSPTCRATASVLGKVFPEWVNFEVNAPSGEPLYSPNFNTIWANAPYFAAAIGPRVTSENDQIVYGTYADALDGAAYALTTIYNTSSGKWSPSIGLPVSSYVRGSDLRNRFSYWDDGSNQGFHDSSDYARLMYSRGEVNTFVGTASPHQMLKFGMESVEGVTPASVRTSAYQTFEWLFEFKQSNKLTSVTDKQNTPTLDSYSDKKRKSRRRKGG